MRIRFLTLVLAVMIVWPAVGYSQNELRENIGNFRETLQQIHSQLLSQTRGIVDLRGAVNRNDLLYLNNLMSSVNTVETCLYYQLELAKLYLDSTSLDETFVKTHFPKMAEQLDFTRSNLEFENARITHQYLQIINNDALTLIENVKSIIHSAMLEIDKCLQWIDETRPESGHDI